MRPRLFRLFFVFGICPFLSLLWCGALRAQELGNIVGQIRLQDGGFPPERIMVTLEGRGAIINSSYCDDDGRFGFYGLLANAYYLIIQAKEYQPIREKVVVVPTISQTNIVHLVLRPLPGAETRASPDSRSLFDPNFVDVSDFAKKFPTSVLREFESGMKSEHRGEMDAAIRHYQAAIRQAPDFYPAHNNLGIRQLQKGDFKAAEEEFRRVLELNSNSPQACFNLGNVLYLTRRYDEAKRILEDGLRRDPTSAMGYYLLGSVLVRLGDLNGAEERFKAAREFDPQMSQVPIALATLYLQTGRQREASEMFESFLRQFPKDPMVPKVRAALGRIAAHSSP
jgi:tetratricopeptide (TPR) repeat protein